MPSSARNEPNVNTETKKMINIFFTVTNFLFELLKLQNYKKCNVIKKYFQK